MKAPKKSEELLFEEISAAAKTLISIQRNLLPGQILALYRKVLGMSQRELAQRAKIPQPSISGIESGRLQPNVKSWEKIASALDADLLIALVPRKAPELFREKQARKVAKKKLDYLRGTMSLEKQEPDCKLLDEI